MTSGTEPSRRYRVITNLKMIIWLSWRESIGKGVRQVVCAKCNYPVHGWSSNQCPECGRNAMRGVIDPSKPHSELFMLTIRRPVYLVLWSFAAIPLSACIIFPLWMVLPWPSDYEWRADFESVNFRISANAETSAYGQARSNAPPFGHVTLYLDLNHGYAKFAQKTSIATVDLEANTISYELDGAMKTEPLSADSLETWFRKCGIDVHESLDYDTKVEPTEHTKELLIWLADAHNGKLPANRHHGLYLRADYADSETTFVSTRMFSFGRVRHEELITMGGVAICFMIWFAGFAAVYRKFRSDEKLYKDLKKTFIGEIQT